MIPCAREGLDVAHRAVELKVIKKEKWGEVGIEPRTLGFDSHSGTFLLLG